MNCVSVTKQQSPMLIIIDIHIEQKCSYINPS